MSNSIDLDELQVQENAKILLKGIWYSELPPIIDFSSFSSGILNVISSIQNKKSKSYKFDKDNFITDFLQVFSPKYIREKGVEGITYYDFKNNKTLREMQIPNLKHYIAFIYNTLLMCDDIFEQLYIKGNKMIISNSASYLMFEKQFKVEFDYDEEIEIDAGIFAEKNNKITGSATMNHTREIYYDKQDCYLYKMKIDLESFFPNLYTHYFERISQKEPFKSLSFPEKYFTFLDVLHQRVNDNQTKGIPAGIFSSHVAAEFCMLCVDYKIRELIKDKDVSYVRYVDDFTFFSNSQETLNEIKTNIQMILNEFRLRLNGGKTEIISCIYDLPIVDIDEAENICIEILPHNSTKINLYQLKKHMIKLIENNDISKAKAVLSLLTNHLLIENNIEHSSMYSCFLYMIQLSQTNNLLACKAYKVINSILTIDHNKDAYIDKLLKLRNEIDNKFSNTILQTWHYYTISKYANEEQFRLLINELSILNNNPIILSTLVQSGVEKNRQLFNYIVTEFEKCGIRENWKKEIMSSKYWLPLFVIKMKDSKNYHSFFESNSFPDVFKTLIKNEESYN